MTDEPAATARALSICLWCAAAIVVEVLLYLSYRGHDARFHWLTHFLVGASFALALMTVQSWRTRRPTRFPLVWLLLAHLYAMVPDLLFSLGVPHYRWMEVFLGHISSHFAPGRNFAWLAVFAASLGVYLLTLDRTARANSGFGPGSLGGGSGRRRAGQGTACAAAAQGTSSSGHRPEAEKC